MAIMGEEIQVFLDGVTLACATSCKVNISADEIDVSCKDCAGFSNTIPNKINWTITSDNLFVVGSYTSLVDAMLNKTTVGISFSSVANFSGATAADEDGHRVPSGGWTSAGDLYYGKATISSIDLTADNGSVATYSVTFNGKGALTKGSPTT